MDELVDYEDNSTNCMNFSTSEIQKFKYLSIFSIIGILLLLVPTSILQLFFIYRYKSTFLHRQFLYATAVVILINIIYIVYPSSLNVGCPLFYLTLDSLSRCIIYVEMLQMTTIHLLLLYKLCKHVVHVPRTMQRLQALCCNIRPRLWHDVMIMCIQFALPLPVLISEFVVMMKTHTIYFVYVERIILIKPLLAVNVLLGLTCTVLLVLWFCILWKRKLLKNKAIFVFTQMGHIFFVLVVFLIWNIICLFAIINHATVAHSALRAIAPVSFGVYFLMSIPSLQRKVTTKAYVPVTNRHTNPPSTRVSLPTDTAEHAPNFLSPSTAEPSEVTPLVNNETLRLL